MCKVNENLQLKAEKILLLVPGLCVFAVFRYDLHRTVRKRLKCSKDDVFFSYTHIVLNDQSDVKNLYICIYAFLLIMSTVTMWPISVQ